MFLLVCVWFCSRGWEVSPQGDPSSPMDRMILPHSPRTWLSYPSPRQGDPSPLPLPREDDPSPTPRQCDSISPPPLEKNHRKRTCGRTRQDDPPLLPQQDLNLMNLNWKSHNESLFSVTFFRTFPKQIFCIVRHEMSLSPISCRW